MVARDCDFLKPVRDELARKAGHVCSNPDCRAPTTGGKYVGRAAHITAASPDGPRYDASLSDEQRKSAENGIHLCNICADKIDQKPFPSSETLREWKRNRELEAEHALGKPKAMVESASTDVAGTHEACGIGVITGLDIRSSTRIQPGTVVRATGLGTVTATKVGGS